MNVLVLQPAFPEYRRPLFDRVDACLARRGHRLVVSVPRSNSVQRSRRDGASAPYLAHHRLASMPPWRGRAIPLHYRATRAAAARADVVVAGLQSSALDTYLLAVSRTPLVLWGHGAASLGRQGKLDRRLEDTLVRRASAVMTYTERGRDGALKRYGTKVVAIGNSTDTAVLRRAYTSLRSAEVEALRETLTLGTGPTALYVGSLDDYKRIPLLLAAAREAHQQEPGFRLIIAGSGPLLPLVTSEASRAGSPTRHLQRADRAMLGRLGRLADVVWMPGRIGLVACDALALGLPVHTAQGAVHAPEVDYLAEGESLHTLPPSAPGFARASLARLAAAGPRELLRPALPGAPTLEDVAAAFARTVLVAAGESP